MADSKLTLKEAAERACVSSATLKPWARSGVIPGVEGGGDDWTPAAVKLKGFDPPRKLLRAYSEA